MSFVIDLAFATEHDKEAFAEKILPRVRGHSVELPLPAEDESDALHHLGVAVTSPSAAKDLCHQMVAFLAHAKTGRIDVRWTAADGQVQTGEVNANSARDAEILALRLAPAVKAHMEAEKASTERQASTDT